MKLIKNFEINTNNLSALKESRVFKVLGDNGAVFSLQVKTGHGKFYNFKSRLFESTITSEHRLKNQTIIGKSYGGQILFPASSGDTYTILLFAEPHFDTKITNNLTGSVRGISLEYNPVLYQLEITQVANVDITFQPISAASANYTEETFTQIERITQTPGTGSPEKKIVNWTIENVKDEAESAFGLVPNETITMRDREGVIPDGTWKVGSSLVIKDTKSDDGGGSTHYNYIVDSISDVEIGMIVEGQNCTITQAVIGAWNSSDPKMRNKPVIKLSASRAFANNASLSLTGYGINAINKVTGCDITLGDFKLTQAPLTTTVRGTGNTTRTRIDTNGTLGIGCSSVGTFVEGFGIDNSTLNPITTVTLSEEEGSITMTTSQTLIEGTVLNLIGSSSSYTITGDVTVNRIPDSNKVIQLDLDKILTIGTESA